MRKCVVMRRTETGNGDAWDGADTGVFGRCDVGTVKEVLQREDLLFLCPARHDGHVEPRARFDPATPRCPSRDHERWLNHSAT